jgi:hypothetical protein
MKKSIALLVIVAVAIVIFIFLKASLFPFPNSNVTSELNISNFSFAEVPTGPAACNIKVENKIIFEGPIKKPTPCNGLTANYTINDKTIKINITTTPFEGFCAQVMADTFYRGSFDLSESATIQIFYGGEKICEKTLTIS